MSRGFNTMALASALLLAVAIALFVSSFRKFSHEPLVSLSPTFHVTVTDTRLAFFNTPMGPYRGSLLFLDFIDDGVQFDAFGDSMGIYYRHIRWPTGEVIWSLMVSLWYPIMLFSVLPTIRVLRYIQIRSVEAREPSDFSADPVHLMPEEFRTASLVDPWGDPQPPWCAFPDIPRFSVGWRMAPGKLYWRHWHEWYRTVSTKHQSRYRGRHRPPLVGWGDFYLWKPGRSVISRCLFPPLAVLWIWYTLPLRCLLYPLTVWGRIQI